MNFFEHQEAARRKSRWLIFFFFLALVLIILTVNLVVNLCLFDSSGIEFQETDPALSLKTHAIISLITLVVIGGASWYRMSQLQSGGGDMVALSLGGTWVDRESSDTSLHRLCNVVEEMSIASGVPTPYLCAGGRKGNQRLCRRLYHRRCHCGGQSGSP